MILYLAGLLDIIMSNNVSPCNGKEALVLFIYKGGDQTLVGNYRSVSVTSLVWKQTGHFTARYLREIWEIVWWLMRVSMVLDQDTQLDRVFQDIADSLDDGVRTNALRIVFQRHSI